MYPGNAYPYSTTAGPPGYSQNPQHSQPQYNANLTNAMNNVSLGSMGSSGSAGSFGYSAQTAINHPSNSIGTLFELSTFVLKSLTCYLGPSGITMTAPGGMGMALNMNTGMGTVVGMGMGLNATNTGMNTRGVLTSSTLLLLT